ncbi:phage tail tape measure protein [Hydrogenimonas thermophila]|uniref:phage tail tape measure protein n=1 Tax=Hydrogenimonas thermophila TaxID=223786 RepID=UPI002936E76E|nr:phage tail tape measure protein [Hydrogenimonas thermophila]WOE69079.1 phage tail tape measure protein [Hydrogenimonas thermophila]WOE71589.1 phage tail tape measure protein [Hydrogenimonas thermophila]
MSTKTLGLTITIGAALQATFGNAFKTVEEKTASLSKNLRKIDFKKELAKNIVALDREFKRLKTAQERAGGASKELKRKLFETAQALNKAKKEAKAYGIELKNASKIQKALEKLENVKTEVGVSLVNTQNRKQIRENLRGQIFDKIALGATVAVPIKAAINFESAMADVGKVVNFKDKAEFKAFGDEILKMSTKIPIAADGLAAIAASAGQLGIAKNKILGFTDIVAKMSTAFDMGADEAGESVAKLMNVYSLALKDVNSLGDAINHLSDNTAAKAKDIVNVLARIGGTAKMFGLSATQASALADAFLAMGKSPEVAATAINSLLNRLQTADKQGKKFQDALAKIGMSSADIKFKIQNNPQEAIMSVLKSIKELDKEEQMGILTDMFGTEYADDIALLVSGLDNYKKAIKLTAKEENYRNSMQKEFDNRSKTTANQLQLLGNSVTRIGINIGSVFLPAINSVVKGIANTTNIVADFAREHPLLTKVVGGLAAGMIGLSIATFALRYAYTFLADGVGALFRGTKLLLFWTSAEGRLLAVNNAKLLIASARTKSLAIWKGILAAKTKLAAGAAKLFGFVLRMNPIGLAITAIAALGAALEWAYKKFEWFRNGVNTVWEWVKKIFSFSPLGIVIKAWQPVFDWLGSKFEWFGKAVDGIKSIGSKIASFFGFVEEEKKTNIGKMVKNITIGTAVATTTATAQPTKPAEDFYIKTKNHLLQKENKKDMQKATHNYTININVNKTDAKPEEIARAVQKAIAKTKERKFEDDE